MMAELLRRITSRDFLLGRLDVTALPFYSVIAMMAASLVVIGGLVTLYLLSRHRLWGRLWREWLTSVDHKRIGIMYIVLSLVMLARALAEAVLMRVQQVVGFNSAGIVPPDHFAQLFTTHGTIMIFFMGMPFMIGLYNLVMPLQIGARDVSFPVMNAISLAFTTAGAALLMISLCVGKFSTGGWSGYPPYTETGFSPDVGVDYWIWALTLSSIGNTMTGINFAVTIYKKRAPGMRLFLMPLFTWTCLCVSILMIFAMPPLTVATLMLAMDRYLDAHFFTNDMGGNVMNYVNMFWLFGHPEVYILVLPAFGVYSETIAVFSSKTLYGYHSLVWATIVIAVLSFTVWLHHFFTMGQDGQVNAAFGIATILIAIPTGVKIYNWILTMFRGRIRLTVPMLYACAFILLFTVGGCTGIILANPGLDYQVHNTVFLVAHFHNVLIPGLLFGMLSGYHYWFPKAFGFRLDEKLGRYSFWCWVWGFIFAFMPLYVSGLMGMPRRTQSYTIAAWHDYALVAMFGAVLISLAFIFLILQLVVSIRKRQEYAVFDGDPWDGRTLEWAVSAPAPEYNFAQIPHVAHLDAFYVAKQAGAPYPAPESYRSISMPASRSVAPICLAALIILGFALTWHMFWLAALALIGFGITIIVSTFQPDKEEVFSTKKIRAHEKRWRQALMAHHSDAATMPLADGEQG